MRYDLVQNKNNTELMLNLYLKAHVDIDRQIYIKKYWLMKSKILLFF